MVKSLTPIFIVSLVNFVTLSAGGDEPSRAKPAVAPHPRGAYRIAIDGAFDDWENVPGYSDPDGDSHDVVHKLQDDTPNAVDHPDADLVEYKAAHDANALYVYFRSKGSIGRTATSPILNEGGRV